YPALVRTVDAIATTVVLLVQAVGVGRVHDDAVRIVAVRYIRVGHEVCGATAVERCPVTAPIRRFERAADGHTYIQVRRIPGIDEDGMEELAIGRAELHPLATLRVIVESGHGLPRVAAV